MIKIKISARDFRSLKSTKRNRFNPRYSICYETPISRRNFASTLAVGTAGAMAFPYISQSAHHASAANKLNVACVGIGHMGNVAVKDALSENIVALCGLR